MAVSAASQSATSTPVPAAQCSCGHQEKSITITAHVCEWREKAERRGRLLQEIKRTASRLKGFSISLIDLCDEELLKD